MRIGILGGSFDPPHLGHALAARQVLACTDIEKVWLMPAYKHTFDKNLSSVSDRLAMTRLLSVSDTVVSTLEIDNELDGNTINLVPLLKQNNPNDAFTFVIGSDQVADFPKWGEWRRLLTELPFLVVPREGFAATSLPDGMALLRHKDLEALDISSTMIRERASSGQSIASLVPKPIAEYIKEHKLYKS